MIDVRKARALDSHRVRVVFSDGTEGVADLRETVNRNPYFLPLRDGSLFRKAFADHGTVCWPGDLNIAPGAIYALAHGLPHPATFEQVRANELEMSLRELRKSSGKTQVVMAKKAGLTQAALSQFERQQDRRLSTLRKYLQALGWEMKLVAVRGKRQITLRGV